MPQIRHCRAGETNSHEIRKKAAGSVATSIFGGVVGFGLECPGLCVVVVVLVHDRALEKPKLVGSRRAGLVVRHAVAVVG